MKRVMKPKLTNKEILFDELLDQVNALSDCQINSFFYLNSTLANVSALLYRSLPLLNWVGFYFLVEDKTLVLGPFHGEVACVTLAVGRGVCQKAVEAKSVVRVADVNEFPSHISCDSHSQSELVVPLFVKGDVVAVLDVDSSEKHHFTDELELFFTKVGEILTSCFNRIPNYLDILKINSHYIDSSDEGDE